MSATVISYEQFHETRQLREARKRALALKPDVAPRDPAPRDERVAAARDVPPATPTPDTRP